MNLFKNKQRETVAGYSSYTLSADLSGRTGHTCFSSPKTTGTAKDEMCCMC